MRRALIVGIDGYASAPLRGCVSDARSMESILSKHDDGNPNFECFVMTAPDGKITRTVLWRSIEQLMEGKADVALFYFSGHGIANSLGGYLVTQDAVRYDEGVAMQDVLTIANRSTKIGEIVVLLDCCHSGFFGQSPAVANESSVLREGLTILTASRADQVSLEVGEGGVFTKLLVGALNGGASDIMGRTTIASVYAYVDQVLGAWAHQRPLFKSNVSTLVSLRECRPSVPLDELRRLSYDFPTPDYDFKLNPSYEPYKDDPEFAPIKEPRSEEHEKIFQRLQKFRAARLVIPVGEEHMYYAAMRYKSCKLTPLGRFYWRLAKDGKI
jgi:hypothetical protein